MTAKWRFDLSAGTPTYYGIVCVGQSFRAIATMAATAVAMVGLLPAAHVHDGDQHQVVHRHVIGDGSAHHDPSPHHAEVDPANHDDARVLTLSYETASPFSLTRHLAVTTLLIGCAPLMQTPPPPQGPITVKGANGLLTPPQSAAVVANAFSTASASAG